MRLQKWAFLVGLFFSVSFFIFEQTVEFMLLDRLSIRTSAWFWIIMNMVIFALGSLIGGTTYGYLAREGKISIGMCMGVTIYILNYYMGADIFNLEHFADYMQTNRFSIPWGYSGAPIQTADKVPTFITVLIVTAITTVIFGAIGVWLGKMYKSKKQISMERQR